MFFGFEVYGKQIAKFGAGGLAGSVDPATGLFRTTSTRPAWLSGRVLATERYVNEVTDAAFILPFKAIAHVAKTPVQVAIRRAIGSSVFGRKLIKKVSVIGLPDGSITPGGANRWFTPTIDRDTSRAVAEYAWISMVRAKKSHIPLDDYALFGDMLR